VGGVWGGVWVVLSGSLTLALVVWGGVVAIPLPPPPRRRRPRSLYGQARRLRFGSAAAAPARRAA
jgi:hypothetical protein